MTRRARSSAVLLALVPLFGVVALGGAPVWAQGQALAGWTFVPSLTVSGEYDSNIEGTASDPKCDFIGRISPGLGLTFIGQKFSFFARYSVDAELYADRSDLNNFGENQRASLGGIWVPDPLTTLGLDLNSRLQTTPRTFFRPGTTPSRGRLQGPLPTSAGPGQIRPPTVAPTIGVDVGRQQSWALSVSPYVMRQFGPSTSGNLGYTYTHTDVDGGTSGSAHSVSLGAARAFTAVDQGSLTVHIPGVPGGGERHRTTHSLLVGWGSATRAADRTSPSRQALTSKTARLAGRRTSG